MGTSSYRVDSIFEADCPACGAPLQALSSVGPDDGLMWRCRSCGFSAERSGGVLIDRSNRTQQTPTSPGGT